MHRSPACGSAPPQLVQLVSGNGSLAKGATPRRLVAGRDDEQPSGVSTTFNGIKSATKKITCWRRRCYSSICQCSADIIDLRTSCEPMMMSESDIQLHLMAIPFLRRRRRLAGSFARCINFSFAETTLSNRFGDCCNDARGCCSFAGGTQMKKPQVCAIIHRPSPRDKKTVRRSIEFDARVGRQPTKFKLRSSRRASRASGANR